MSKILSFLSVIYILAVSSDATTFEKNGITYHMKYDMSGYYSLSTHGMHVLTPGLIADIENIEWMEIDQQNLTDVEPGTFRNLPKLRRLKITANNIPHIKTGIFNSLSNLTNLELYVNSVYQIDPNAFDNMTTLKYIGLSFNQLESVDPHWFLQTPSLEFIDLRYNRLTKLPASSFGNIKSPGPFILWFDGNYITRIDKDAFSGMKTISTLSLDGNKLKTMTGDFLLGREIDWLSFRANKIECIDQRHFATVFVANYTKIWSNSWHMECFKKIKTWAKENHKNVLYDPY
ncbi:hypothetical protein Zmor_000758 [Zophobas morio]|uniref:Uncharacterized protein n=1 Tax=Zophobas morio TaxID=2755281 RepID=A0AA38MNR0_9CUCU|nr:hypothetical protein Zmor_000758 [Zophobas morio]